MKKIGIYVNKNKDRDFSITKKISSYVEKEGFLCQVISDSKDLVDTQILINKEESIRLLNITTRKIKEIIYIKELMEKNYSKEYISEKDKTYDFNVGTE